MREAAPMETGMGAVNVPYAIPNLRFEVGPADAKVRIGWLRSVCNVFHSFAVNCFSDEIAQARGLDPRDNLLQLLGPDRTIDVAALGLEATENYPFETGRLRHVIELVTERAVEVAVQEDGSWSVPRVDLAIDCGTYVNADRVRAQQEGAVIFGLSLARDSEITAAGGRIVQGNFNDYRDAHPPGAERGAAVRGRRARRAADRAGRGQRLVRRHRQAVPRTAAGREAGSRFITALHGLRGVSRATDFDQLRPGASLQSNMPRL
ncbi:MAG: molybdopterin-dependent oxidoreductase [Xanthomonadales bacterium]|nr:molybdopterin-dependent oxidoreductase [Xanthomonadales bacterium]